MVEDFWTLLIGVILRFIGIFVMVRFVIPKQINEWKDQKTDLRLVKSLLLGVGFSVLISLCVFSSYQVAKLLGIEIIDHLQGEFSFLGSLNNLFVVLILYYLYYFKL